MDSPPDLLASPFRTGQNAVKAVNNGDGTVTVSGIAVVFDTVGSGKSDLAGDFFTADTYLSPALKRGGEDEVEATYNHGFPTRDEFADLAEHEFAHAVTVKATPAGLLASLILEERDEYEKMLADMALAGKLAWSSGTAPHRMRRVKHTDGLYEIKRWPLAEIALTPQPCEPRTFAVPVKSIGAVKAAGESLSARIDRVHRASYAGLGERGYAIEVFDDAIIADLAGICYRVPYTDDGGAVTFAPAPQWERVERTVTYDAVTKALADFNAGPAAYSGALAAFTA